ncbi:MAG: leucyl aminopeptidase family protein [Candidatus Moranbacteria bacterium]|nr:leucyl aminopeptidase family protein [Candidatus Moranbacteria bacterium]
MKFSVVSSVSGVEKDACTVRLVAPSEVERFVEADGVCFLEIPFDVAKVARRRSVLLFRRIVSLAKKYHLENLILAWDEVYFSSLSISVADYAEMVGVAMEMAHYEFRRFRTVPKEGWKDVKNVSVVVSDSSVVRAVRFGLGRSKQIALWVNRCRDFANTPGADMTPRSFVSTVSKLVKNTSIRMTVLDEKKISQLKMGGVLGVSKGSVEPPRFLILEYSGGKKTDAPIVLVGKGVTFDTGGIDVKPYPYALDMNMDMSGGAAVVSTLFVAHDLKVKKNIVVLVPLVENMMSGSAFRPGDILTAMDGTTMEVRNTDAEGRLILADALCYARRWKPQLVIDVATLTGAALGALGERASAVFTQDDLLAQKMFDCGESSGDYVWRLPLWEEHGADIKGVFGDIANLRTVGSDRYAGASSAAAFLHHFAKDFSLWVHVDMAPRMTSVHDEFLAKGAAGAPVRLLLRLLETI